MLTTCSSKCCRWSQMFVVILATLCTQKQSMNIMPYLGSNCLPCRKSPVRFGLQRFGDCFDSHSSGSCGSPVHPVRRFVLFQNFSDFLDCRDSGISRISGISGISGSSGISRISWTSWIDLCLCELTWISEISGFPVTPNTHETNHPILVTPKSFFSVFTEKRIAHF